MQSVSTQVPFQRNQIPKLEAFSQSYSNTHSTLELTEMQNFMIMNLFSSTQLNFNPPPPPTYLLLDVFCILENLSSSDNVWGKRIYISCQQHSSELGKREIEVGEKVGWDMLTEGDVFYSANGLMATVLSTLSSVVGVMYCSC